MYLVSSPCSKGWCLIWTKSSQTFKLRACLAVQKCGAGDSKTLCSQGFLYYLQ